MLAIEMLQLENYAILKSLENNSNINKDEYDNIFSAMRNVCYHVYLLLKYLLL